jgi:hypothetical protein
MPNILDPQYRKSVIDQINGDENRRRKNDSLKRFDIYQKRQERYILEKLRSEYSAQTVQEMRVISSINLARRIVDEKASLYTKAPERQFTYRDGTPLPEKQVKQLQDLYRYGHIDISMKKANRYYKLESQAALQVIPKDGVICSRVLLPHHYDVIPDPVNPEMAFAYVISVYDRSLLYNQTSVNAATSTNYLTQSESDQINQIIADPEDANNGKGKFIWWTAEYNFITDGWGNMIHEDGSPMMIRTQEDLSAVANPIEQLPFVDIAMGKEFEFWVRQGNDVVQFAIDFSALLSDTAEVNKRQGYSQAIVYSQQPPKDMMVGPNRVLHMQLDPNTEIQPKFEWSSPQPDMQASLDLLESYLRLFLSAEGMDPKTVSGRLEGTKYSSGVDRLLAMIEKFEASSDDIDLFNKVEDQTLKIAVAWSNLMQGATVQVGVQPLLPELQAGALPEDVQVNVNYKKPEAVQTKSETEDSVIKRVDAGLMSKKSALMELDGLTEEQAEKALAEIDDEDGLGGADPGAKTQDKP